MQMDPPENKRADAGFKSMADVASKAIWILLWPQDNRMTSGGNRDTEGTASSLNVFCQ